MNWIKLDAIRQVREPLLLEADWQINKLNDSKSDASKWIAYRIKLRDITKGVDTVDKAKAVTMPKKPWVWQGQKKNIII